MCKEELIKLIESLNMEEINSISISYFTEKEEMEVYTSCTKERQLKTISYGDNINKRLEYIRRDIDDMAERIQRNNCMIIEEMINEKLRRNNTDEQ